LVGAAGRIARHCRRHEQGDHFPGVYKELAPAVELEQVAVVVGDRPDQFRGGRIELSLPLMQDRRGDGPTGVHELLVPRWRAGAHAGAGGIAGSLDVGFGSGNGRTMRLRPAADTASELDIDAGVDRGNQAE
jgi:hypothetical protein